MTHEEYSYEHVKFGTYIEFHSIKSPGKCKLKFHDLLKAFNVWVTNFHESIFSAQHEIFLILSHGLTREYVTA